MICETAWRESNSENRRFNRLHFGQPAPERGRSAPNDRPRTRGDFRSAGARLTAPQRPRATLTRSARDADATPTRRLPTKMNDQPSDGKIRLFALSSLAKMERAETRAVLEKFRRAPGDTELVLAERYAEDLVAKLQPKKKARIEETSSPMSSFSIKYWSLLLYTEGPNSQCKDFDLSPWMYTVAYGLMPQRDDDDETASTEPSCVLARNERPASLEAAPFEATSPPEDGDWISIEVAKERLRREVLASHNGESRFRPYTRRTLVTLALQDEDRASCVAVQRIADSLAQSSIPESLEGHFSKEDIDYFRAHVEALGKVVRAKIEGNMCIPLGEFIVSGGNSELGELVGYSGRALREIKKIEKMLLEFDSVVLDDDDEEEQVDLETLSLLAHSLSLGEAMRYNRVRGDALVIRPDAPLEARLIVDAARRSGANGDELPKLAKFMLLDRLQHLRELGPDRNRKSMCPCCGEEISGQLKTHLEDEEDCFKYFIGAVTRAKLLRCDGNCPNDGCRRPFFLTPSGLRRHMARPALRVGGVFGRRKTRKSNDTTRTFEEWWFCMRCGLEASDEENFTQRRKGPPHKYYENKFDPDGGNTLCKVCGIRYERFEKAGKLEQFGKLLDPWSHAQQLGKKRRS